MLQRISAVAMISGFAASFLVGVLVVLLGSFLVTVLGVSDEATLSELEGALFTDLPLVAVALIGALSSAFAAGYAAATTAPGDELLNALAVGVLLVAVSAAGYQYLRLDLYPLWYTIPAFVLTVPLSLVGGLVRRGPNIAA